MLVPSQTFGLVLGGAQLSRCLLPGMKLPLQVSQSVHLYTFVLIQISLPVPLCVEEAECERLVVGCYRLILFLYCKRIAQTPQMLTKRSTLFSLHSSYYKSSSRLYYNCCAESFWGAEPWRLMS